MCSGDWWRWRGVCGGTGRDGGVCSGDWWRWGVCVLWGLVEMGGVVGTRGDAIDVGPPL